MCPSKWEIVIDRKYNLQLQTRRRVLHIAYILLDTLPKNDWIKEWIDFIHLLWITSKVRPQLHSKNS